MPNRLRDSASPYLRSHAENPVDWWPWGPEPFAEAARRDVPVMVSIGYSTCHWCHVMARESFSDPQIAGVLNENFVAIKVDREEHAEVDNTYMAAAGAFTSNLGWPLTVFVTPQGRAFFAGTYWPPEAAHGHRGFRQVLGAVLDAWRERRVEVESNGEAIGRALSNPRPNEPVPVDFDAIVEHLEGIEDAQFGGFGAAPKFPVAPVLAFLLGQPGAGHALALRTLDAMAASGLRDPVEGGFFRYATQRDWSEPHYERMLYDNAQLLVLYAGAGNADVAEGIASYLLDVLQQPSGGFASAQDSESTVDGARVEGFYYSLDAASRSRLERPPLDEKILTGLNGLAIQSLAVAGTRLERTEWVGAAQRAADFLLEHHVQSGRLLRSSIDGVASTAVATLEDYGMLAAGLLALSIACGEVRYAEAARELVDACIAAVGDAGAGTGDSPFAVPEGGDPVLAAQGIVMAADDSDGAHPSGRSAMASAARTLFALTGDAGYRTASEAALAGVSGQAAASPMAYGAALAVMASNAGPLRQLVVVGGGEAAARARREPQGVTVVVTADQALAFAAAGFELFEGRTTTPGRTTSYLCDDFVCRLPSVD